MYKVNTSTYEKLLVEAYNTKSPFMVYGAPGIGKSSIGRQVFPSIAKKTDRQYFEWSNLNKDQRVDAINNPEKYFIYCDQRVGQMDSTDLRGIPKMDGEWLEVCPLSWIVYFTQQKAAGVIMFDEINLAPPTVAGQAYQIIQERSISDRRVSDDVLIMAAGNRGQDKAFTFDMPLPLRDRFNEIELTIDYVGWTKWAAKSNVNSHFVAFINWKPTYLYTLEDVAGGDKGASPRGIERASILVNDLDITTDDAIMLISSACGEAWANEFEGYVKHVKSLNWDTILANPSSVKNFSIDKLWAVAGGLPALWSKSKNPEEMFDKICPVIENMREDFSIVTILLMRDSNQKLWKQCIKNSQCFKRLATKYVKFLIEMPQDV